MPKTGKRVGGKTISMKKIYITITIAATFIFIACGGPSANDQVKKAHIRDSLKMAISKNSTVTVNTVKDSIRKCNLTIEGTPTPKAKERFINPNFKVNYFAENPPSKLFRTSKKTKVDGWIRVNVDKFDQSNGDFVFRIQFESDDMIFGQYGIVHFKFKDYKDSLLKPIDSPLYGTPGKGNSKTATSRSFTMVGSIGSSLASKVCSISIEPEHISNKITLPPLKKEEVINGIMVFIKVVSSI